jgi:hypothetical protein
LGDLSCEYVLASVDRAGTRRKDCMAARVSASLAIDRAAHVMDAVLHAAAAQCVSGPCDPWDMTDAYRYFPTGEMVDRQNMQSTARASEDSARAALESRALIDQLVQHSTETARTAEVRERQMLRWTQAGVVLAAVAAVASIIAVIVTVLLAS